MQLGTHTMVGQLSRLVVVLGALLSLSSFGRAGFLPQTRVRGTYGVSNCNAFSGQLGKILSCDAYASASGFVPDDVFCVTRLTSCEDINSRRRNLLELDSRVTITLDTLLDPIEAEEKARNGTANTEGFRSSFRTTAEARGETQRVASIDTIDIEDEGAVTESPVDEPGECDTDTDCDVQYYLRPFCLVPAAGDVPFPTECVECLVPPYCQENGNCGCDNGQVCVDFICVPELE